VKKLIKTHTHTNTHTHKQQPKTTTTTTTTSKIRKAMVRRRTFFNLALIINPNNISNTLADSGKSPFDRLLNFRAISAYMTGKQQVKCRIVFCCYHCLRFNFKVYLLVCLFVSWFV